MNVKLHGKRVLTGRGEADSWFFALLDKVRLRKAPHLGVKVTETDEVAENPAGIVN
jgi:hypothetical protein